MKTVVVIATGGTLASATDASGAKSAQLDVRDILQKTSVPAGLQIRTVAPFTCNSYQLGFREMDLVLDAVRKALADPSVTGIVVTHGTDTLEETAMLVAIAATDSRPIVVTGAQRSADTAASDGPGNLRDAITVAAAADSYKRGTLIVFGGVIHAAIGTRKIHNTALNAFLDVDAGPLGTITDGEILWDSPAPAHARPALCPEVHLSQTQIDTVALYPGVTRVAIDALVDSGASGLVLQGTGYGNANEQIVAAVQQHTQAGIVFVLSSRVAGGQVRAVYGGGGGGVDLVRVGAIPSGFLRPSQARILLAALMASGATRRHIDEAFQTIS